LVSLVIEMKRRPVMHFVFDLILLERKAKMSAWLLEKKKPLEVFEEFRAQEWPIAREWLRSSSLLSQIWIVDDSNYQGQKEMAHLKDLQEKKDQTNFDLEPAVR
jgi:hypothetical protein